MSLNDHVDFNEPFVSIVILNAFIFEDVFFCLKSLNHIDYSNYEIILVDYKTPQIKDYIARDFPKVKLISLTGSDIGPSAMHNIAIKQIDQRSKYITFLDSDTVVDCLWLRELVNSIEHGHNIGAVQSKILLYDSPKIMNTSGDKANYLAVGWPDGFGNLDHHEKICKEISFPSGASSIYRKEVFEKIGLFDEDYFIYADDMDIGLRTKLAGFRILYCSTSIVYHKYAFLRGKRSFYYLNRNRIHTYYKLYTPKTYVLLLPALLVYEFFIFGYAMLNNLLKELISAYIFNLKNIKKIYIKRFLIKKFKKISDRELVDSLESAITFSEIDYWAVTHMLNPFLIKYKKLLLKFI